MESYVVNIYRREREANMIVGVLEKVGAEERQVFKTLEGLLTLLRADGGQDRRREARLRLEIPILVEGECEDGKRFREQTTLKDLSSHGARFSMKRKAEGEQALRVVIDPDRSACVRDARVAWSERKDDGYTLGLFFT